MPELRLLSYNVRSLRDDTAALARVIRATAPDVVCLQEAPRFARWRHRTAALGRATGLHLAAGGAPAQGVAVLTTLRPVVEQAREVPLPPTPGLHRRALATVVLRLGRARLAVVSCHLGLAADERRRHAALVTELLPELADGAPLVLAGDLNERPRGAARAVLGRALRDGWDAAPSGGRHTFPAGGPDRRIDAVLAGPGVRFLRCGVPAAGDEGPAAADLRAASDHLPVLAVLRIAEGVSAAAGPTAR
ncbi:endonuclease/exonuclease/phosphatase family protein [Streptomyces spiramenti]|uniref:Endonuclease n=1 Tax=Streptomyces spiramenti TaxID=2720606 RepID=A0ABX1ASE3_9ACTN|nr:endonuclease/exonuclease/phosphatase family protein [Streptomyces spiramenti]NJP69250.1 endonuclease [Streptomyces spiramenti]